MLDFEEEEGFRWIIFAVAMICGAITILYETIILPFVFRIIKKTFKKKKKNLNN